MEEVYDCRGYDMSVALAGACSLAAAKGAIHVAVMLRVCMLGS